MGSRKRIKPPYLWYEKMVTRPTRKTGRWRIFNHSNDCLGVVEWSNGWRRYVAVLTGLHGVQMSSECLTELANFLDTQNFLRKEKRERRKDD